MKQYLELCDHVIKNGKQKGDRTGTGTLSTFGYQTRYDLSEGFPIVTTKKMFLKGIIYELLWFLKGDTNIKYLLDNQVKIWNMDAHRDYNEKNPNAPMTYEEFVDYAEEFGYDLGPVYGKQWRSWHVDTEEGPNIDQIMDVIDQIKENPNSRRLIVSAWNVGQLHKMALPPCHILFQFYVEDGKLSCQLYQRSADVFLGVPFNIASYALLVMMIAQVTGLQPGEFIHTFGDLHIYNNHIDQVKLQLTREPKKLPKMYLNPDVTNILDFKYEDFVLNGYESHPKIEGKMST